MSGIQYQRIKITDGTADSSTPLALNAANTARSTATIVVPVQIVDAAGSVMDVAGQGTMAASTSVVIASDQSALLGGISILQTPTITAGAYSAKDAVGGLLTFANAVRVSGGSAVLNTVTIIDNDSENAGLELWLFNADPTVAADNAAMTFTDANMQKCVGVVPISSADYFALADNGAACVRGVGLQFKCAATSLFGQLKCTGTPTYTAVGDLTVVIGVEYVN